MLLLLLSSLLFAFITFNVGYGVLYFIGKNKGRSNSGVFQSILSGVIISFVYFNFCSFFIAANYLLLIPLLCSGIYVSIRFKTLKLLGNRLCYFISRSLAIEKIGTIFVIASIVGYWIIPPINADSGAYHYLTIEWYEKFKVIPGLANLHGRFGFNPASFILSAPYCFSTVLSRAVYPVNGVLIISFVLWLLNLIIISNSYIKKICLLFVLLFVLRLLLVNVSSPSSDALAVIVATYIILNTLNINTWNAGSRHELFLFSLILFSVTVKLTLLPLLLILPLLFISRVFSFSRTVIYCISAGAIVIPWLMRNYLMSGYLAYPLSISDLGILKPDWKVPQGIIMLDNLYIKYGPYMLRESISDQLKFTLMQRLCKWIVIQFQSKMFIELFLLSFSLISFLFWFFILKSKIKINKNVFYLWLVTYIGSLFWIIKSPDYRFGSVYLIMSIFIPFTFLFNNLLNSTAVKKSYFGLLFITCLISVYYCKSALFASTTYPFTLKDVWLFPMKDIRYKNDVGFKPNQKVVLNDGKTILYISSENDDLCLHVSLPCMPWNYGLIEMRGENITDGFRLSADRIQENHPFLEY